jgi:C-terminal processing protease CtpA/Prc
MLSSTGESSAVHVRLHYTHMRNDPIPFARAPTPSNVRSPDAAVARPRPIVHEAVSPKRAAISSVSALPNMLQPAQHSGQWHPDSKGYVPAHYKSYDAQVADGFEGMQTVRISPDVPAKPIFIRSCRSTGDFPLVFEVAGMAESITISSCSGVRIVAAMVLTGLHVVTSDDIEIVLGGQAPRVTLSGVQGCSITLHKDTWSGDIECLASSGVSVNAVEGGKQDTLSLQESTAMERILLPDSMRTLVQEGRMTTQCHFTHLETHDEEPPPLVDKVRPEAQRSNPPPPPLTQLDHPSTQLGHQNEQSERFGVGLLLKKTEDGLLQVARVAEGGAAHKDGRVRAGDLLIAINGVETRGKRLRDVGEELSGSLGSEVWIGLQQIDPLAYDGRRIEKHIVLSRAPISTKNPRTTDLYAGPQDWTPQNSENLPYNGGFDDMTPRQPPVSDRDPRLIDTRSRIEQALNDVRPPATSVGVGLIVKPSHDGAYRVSGLVSNGAAEGSGQIAIGDVLHSVDGINVCFKSEDMVRSLVQGPPKSRVVLSLLLPSAQPVDLKRSVDEFDHWRPVVLVRAANPSGHKTPAVAENAEEDYGPPVAVERTNNAALARSPAPPIASPSGEQHSPATHQGPIGLTLYLDEDFNTIAGSDLSRQAFASDLSADLCNALQTHNSRIQVVDLLPGSVLADVHIFPSTVANDNRSPERLAAEIAVQVVDPQSPLRKAKTTRNAQQTEIRGPISEVGSLRKVWTAYHDGKRTSPFIERGGDGSLQSEYSPPLPPRSHSSPPVGDLPSPTPSRTMHQSPTREYPMSFEHEHGNHLEASSILPVNTPERTNPQNTMMTAQSALNSPLQPHAAGEERDDDSTDGLVLKAQPQTSRATPTAASPEPILHSYTPSVPVNGEEEAVRKKEQEEMSRLLKGKGKPVEIIVKLGLDFSSAGADGSQEREEFERELSRNLSHASGLPPANFKVKHMSPGSIVVDTEINPDVTGKFPDPETVAKDLERQVHDVNSPLRSGTITRYAQSITILGLQPTPTAQPHLTKHSVDRPPLPIQPAVTAPSSQVPAPPLLRGSFNDLRNSMGDTSVQKAGVGIVFKRNDYGEIEVIGLRPGSSAERSGAIFVGNKIVSVGPVPVTGAARETVLDLILGTANTRVTLGILRQVGSPGAENGQPNPASITLVRADIPSVPLSQAGSMAARHDADERQRLLEQQQMMQSGVPDASPHMMVLPDALSKTVAHQKEPYDFVGPVRTVALERGEGKPGEFTGVGISFQATKSKGHLIVTKLVPNGPAELSNQIRAGDAILSVNNVVVQGKRIPDVVALIKGPPRSVVVFRLQLTTIVTDTLSQGNHSLYNSVSSYRAMQGPGYDSRPRAPGSAPPMSTPDPGGPNQPPSPVVMAISDLPPGAGPNFNPALHRQAPPHPQRSNAPPGSRGSSAGPMLPPPKGGSAGPMLPPQGAVMYGFRVVRLKRRNLNPEFGLATGGVGLGFERDQAGIHTVCNLYPGGTAAESGRILVGDKVLSVDGVPTQGLSVRDVSEMIRGKVDTDVALTLETLDPASSAQQGWNASPTEFNSRQSDSAAPMAAAPVVDEGGVYVVGLVLSEPSPPSACQIVGSDMLMDRAHRLQGQEGYGNDTLAVGDTVIAINGKILQNQTLQQLTEMLSGPLHSALTLMVQNTSGQGDEMFNIVLLRNMSITDYAHWCEYINSPSAPLALQDKVTDALHSALAEMHLSISALDPDAPSEQKYSEDTPRSSIQKQQQSTALRAPAPSRIDPLPEAPLMTTEDAKAFKLCVKVLEVDGIALGPDGNLPFCIANLRLIFPDEVSTANPDSVPAVCPGQAVQFNGVELKYRVQVRHLACECEAHLKPIGKCFCAVR